MSLIAATQVYFDRHSTVNLMATMTQLERLTVSTAADTTVGTTHLDALRFLAASSDVMHAKQEEEKFSMKLKREAELSNLFFAVGRLFPKQCMDVVREGNGSGDLLKDARFLYNRAVARLKVETQLISRQFLRIVASECIQLFKMHLEADIRALDRFERNPSKCKGFPTLSLAAKWAPRESEWEWAHMARVLALHMFPFAPDEERRENDLVRTMRSYRKAVTRLNVALSTRGWLKSRGDETTAPKDSTPSWLKWLQCAFDLKMVKAVIIDPLAASKTLLRSLLSEEWLHEQQGAFGPKRDVLQDAAAVAGRDQLQKVEVMLAELYPGESTLSGDGTQGHCGEKRKVGPSAKSGVWKGGKRRQNCMA